jgi:hypothetical protein
LIRDDERTSLAGAGPQRSTGGRPAVRAHAEDDGKTDIILTLTPHIIRVLDLTEADLRPFRVGAIRWRRSRRYRCPSNRRSCRNRRSRRNHRSPEVGVVDREDG